MREAFLEFVIEAPNLMHPRFAAANPVHEFYHQFRRLWDKRLPVQMGLGHLVFQSDPDVPPGPAADLLVWQLEPERRFAAISFDKPDVPLVISRRLPACVCIGYGVEPPAVEGVARIYYDTGPHASRQYSNNSRRRPSCIVFCSPSHSWGSSWPCPPPIRPECRRRQASPAMFRDWLTKNSRSIRCSPRSRVTTNFDDRMDDLSPDARRHAIANGASCWSRTLNSSTPRSCLTMGRSTSRSGSTRSRTRSGSDANDNRFEFDPRVYGEFISDSVFILFTQSTLPRERNVQNAAKRIASIPKIIAAAKAGLKNPPKILTEIAIKRNLGAIAFFEKDIYEFAKETPGSEPLAHAVQGGRRRR